MWRLAKIENGRITEVEIVPEEEINSYFEYFQRFSFMYENVYDKYLYKKYKSTQFEDLYFEFTVWRRMIDGGFNHCIVYVVNVSIGNG